MKKYIPFLIAGSLVLGTASVSFAQTGGGAVTNTAGTSSNPRMERRADAVAERMERASTTRQNMAEQRAERIERLSENRKQLIRNFAMRMFNRMEAAIERLEKLSDRVTSRITKLKERGINTAKAEQLIATAETELANAKTALASSKTAAEAAVNSENPKEGFELVRTHVRTAQDAIRKAHRAIVDAVVSLKGKSGANTATTTATTTTTN